MHRRIALRKSLILAAFGTAALLSACGGSSDPHVPTAAPTPDIVARAQAYGAELRRDDVRFALEVVGEADPWFEQGASANLFAGRFRNYVVARCRGQGLTLTPDELDLIDAWFAGLGQPQVQQRLPQPPMPQQQPMLPRQRQPTIAAPSADRWWNQAPEQAPNFEAAEEFPRIVKNRLRG